MVGLVAGKLDLIGVDDHHEVAAVGIGRVLRLVLAAQDHGDLRGQTAEHLALSIDEDPVAGDLTLLGVVSRL